MKNAHFEPGITTFGDKISTTNRSNYVQQLEFKDINPAKQQSRSYACEISQYFAIFTYYVKARTPPIYCFPLATLVAVIIGSHGNISPFISLNAVIASYFLALASYVYNDLTDFEVDKINKKNRLIVSGKISKNKLGIIICVMFGIGLSLSASINIYTFSISIFYTVLALLYSHPKFKWKDKFPLKTISTASGAALLSLLGAVAVPNISGPILFTVFSFFIFYFLLSPLGDIGDIKGDRQVGRRTFPIVLGMKTTLWIMISIPVTLLIITGLDYGFLHMKILGAYAMISNCFAIMVLILRISKGYNDLSVIKASRPKMRYLNVLTQLSLLLAFL